MVNMYFEGMKLYASQRKDKLFSKKLLKSVNELQNLVFSEPKSLFQTNLNNYLRQYSRSSS